MGICGSNFMLIHPPKERAQREREKEEEEEEKREKVGWRNGSHNGMCGHTPGKRGGEEEGLNNLSTRKVPFSLSTQPHTHTHHPHQTFSLFSLSLLSCPVGGGEGWMLSLSLSLSHFVCVNCCESVI
jgi:hypothetical protein